MRQQPFGASHQRTKMIFTDSLSGSDLLPTSHANVYVEVARAGHDLVSAWRYSRFRSSCSVVWMQHRTELVDRELSHSFVRSWRLLHQVVGTQRLAQHS